MDGTGRVVDVEDVVWVKNGYWPTVGLDSSRFLNVLLQFANPLPPIPRDFPGGTRCLARV